MRGGRLWTNTTESIACACDGGCHTAGCCRCRFKLQRPTILIVSGCRGTKMCPNGTFHLYSLRGCHGDRDAVNRKAARIAYPQLESALAVAEATNQLCRHARELGVETHDGTRAKSRKVSSSGACLDALGQVLLHHAVHGVHHGHAALHVECDPGHCGAH